MTAECGFRAAGFARRVLCALLITGVVAGCGPTKKQKQASRAVSAYLAGDYSAAADKLAPLADDRNTDFVLNNVRLGSAALARYDFTEAENAFLRAYEVINSVGVNDGGRSLGAVLVDEKLKVWKGEPFERAMANYYLGLIYYIEHDYNNARAAFENALFKLRDYTNADDAKHGYQEQETNFALAMLMLGKCWQRLGRHDLAEANFQRVRDLRSDLAPLADAKLNDESNLLLVVDFGYGPLKVTDFDGAIVAFEPTPGKVGPVPAIRLELDGKSVELDGIARPTIDLLAIAQDRRWQSIDTIRAIKGGIGTGLLFAGGILLDKGLDEHGSAQRRDLTAAAVLAAAGLFLKATSQADVRQWEMLPRSVFVLPLRVPPGTHDLVIDFPGTSGLKQEWKNIVVPETGEATYYFRIQRWHNGPFTWGAPAVASIETAR